MARGGSVPALLLFARRKESLVLMNPEHVVRCVGLVLTMVLLAHTGFGEERQERTLDEIKTESIHRAENGMYPLIGLDPQDVREAFASIHSKDKDEWAA